MSTLISVYNSDGCVGRCDAKCYNATEPECDCICRGRNHGAGRDQAMENTRELAGEWIEAWKRERPDQAWQFDLPPADQQTGLFAGQDLEPLLGGDRPRKKFSLLRN